MTKSEERGLNPTVVVLKLDNYDMLNRSNNSLNPTVVVLKQT